MIFSSTVFGCFEMMGEDTPNAVISVNENPRITGFAIMFFVKSGIIGRLTGAEATLDATV